MSIKGLQYCGLVVNDLEKSCWFYEPLYFQDPDGYMIEFFQWIGSEIADAPERGAVKGMEQG
jgi:hypothetical protein